MNKELIQYITDAKAHGLSEQEIKQNLLDAGWDAATVEESFTHFKVEESKGEVAPVKDPSSLPTVAHQAQAADAAFGTEAKSTEVRTSVASIVGQQVAAIPTESTLQPGGGGFFSQKKNIIIASAVAVVALAVGGYFAYGYYQKNGGLNIKKIFRQAKEEITLKGGTVYQNNFKISYRDPLTYQSTGDSFTDSFFEKLKDFTVSFEGKFYVDASVPENPQSSSNVKYTFASGNTSFSTGLEYKLIDKTFYVNVGDNPFISNILSSETVTASEKKKIDWVKISLAGLEQAIKEGNQEEYEGIKEFFDPSLRNDLGKLWEDARLVKVESTLGTETVNGVNTIHYKNALDKEALKKFLADYIVRLSKASKNELKEKDLQTINLVIGALVDKLQIKEFETWVGASDYYLYKVHLVSNAPSFVSIIKELSNSDITSVSSSDDAKRLADIKQASTALELYYNDNNGYPEARDGKPVDITPVYIGIWPTAPKAGGNCSDYYNSYWYQPTGTKRVENGKTVYSSYELLFCLGHDTGGYPAGIGKLSPLGIQSNIPCPSKEGSKCAQSNGNEDADQKLRQQIQDTINKIDYSAEFRIDADYYDYGKKVDLVVPQNAYDILEALNEARAKARDAKRYADMRQLATALELYYNDKNEYPKELKDMTPTYIGVIPQAPVPQDGQCSPEDNTYRYTRTGAGQYTLTFCLGGTTGSYEAGKRTLTPAGIK